MKYIILNISLLLFCNLINAQEAKITSEDFKPYTHYFSLTEDHEIEGKARDIFLEAVGDKQFVGIAEVHDSKQLSYFTIGFLELLKQKEFDHFALEVGPHSAEILKDITAVPHQTAKTIRKLNRTYGKRLLLKAPIPFINNLEDAMFIRKAAELDFKFWGLDQEYNFSIEMHLDTIFSLVDDGNQELSEYYKKSKKIIRKNIFKRKVNGIPKNCWLLEEPTINQFFKMCKGNPEAERIINDLTRSFDIYCRSSRNEPSNQLRADYMKNNFISLYDQAQKRTHILPKVFVKLGGIHLTHGVSVFGVHDMGEYLSNKAQENRTGFLAIRHLSKYRKGKNVTGKRGWEGNEILMSLGKKNAWTVVDLRPIRKKLKNEEMIADQKTSFEVYNYDLLLIPPNDKKPKRNY